MSIFDRLFGRTPSFSLDPRNIVQPSEKWEALPASERFSDKYSHFLEEAMVDAQAKDKKVEHILDPRLVEHDLALAISVCYPDSKGESSKPDLVLCQKIITAMQHANEMEDCPNPEKYRLTKDHLDVLHEYSIARNLRTDGKIYFWMDNETSQELQRMMVKNVEGMTTPEAIEYFKELMPRMVPQDLKDILTAAQSAAKENPATPTKGDISAAIAPNLKEKGEGGIKH